MNKPESTRLVLAPTTRHAFTLVEMIVVTGIIALLAALIIPVGAAANRSRYLRRTRTEVTLVATAIQGYYDKMGHYPPDNTQVTDPKRYQHNALYYELLGTSNSVQDATFYVRDGSASIPTNAVSGAFGIDGFINCTRGGGGDDRQPAIKFLPELKPGQYVDTQVGTTTCRLLGSAMDGPNSVINASTSRPFTPFWYNCSNPTNSAKSFDLWVDVLIGSKIYRVGNWNTSYQVMN